MDAKVGDKVQLFMTSENGRFDLLAPMGLEVVDPIEYQRKRRRAIADVHSSEL
jgi:hypothetical protein